LDEAIASDLVAAPPYGIKWWQQEMGMKHRVLISDQLCACAASVVENMVEAGLHRLDYRDFTAREDDVIANSVSLRSGQPVFSSPHRQTVMDELVPAFQRLHLVGIIRALASAFDCMAGVIIGVAALPNDILKADFRAVRSSLNRLQTKDRADAGAKLQKRVALRVEEIIADSGPVGWVDWTLDFRNMLVHRGRRLDYGQLIPRLPVLFGPDGSAIPRVRRATHFPRDPGRSEIEVLLEAAWSMALTEEADRTITGLVSSARAMLEQVAGELKSVWELRRATPDILEQPRSQWKGGSQAGAGVFAGYKPGSLKLEPDLGYLPLNIVRRLRASALDDESRYRWATAD
jgi:hypothetical protein